MSRTIVQEQRSVSSLSGVTSVTLLSRGQSLNSQDDAAEGLESPLTLAPQFLAQFSRRLQADVNSSERGPSTAPKESLLHRRLRPTIFHGSKHTPIPVGDYVQRIAEHSKCSHVCFVASFGYLQRLSKVDRKYRLCSRSVHRLLIASVLIAAKLLDDKFYSNAFYARIGGISTKEINKLELEMLSLLDFRVFVSHSDLRACLADLTSEPPSQPLPPGIGRPFKSMPLGGAAVGRKRVNEDPSAETAIPAKLQHSTGKDQILVTPQEPAPPQLQRRSVSAGPLRRGSSGCGREGTWEGGAAMSAAILRTMLDVGC